MDTLVQRLGKPTVFWTSGPPSNAETPTPSTFYACDLDPFDAALSKCPGVILQCPLVFAQQAPSPETKQKYTMSRGCCGDECWPGLWIMRVPRLTSFPFEGFFSRFKRVFDHPGFAGCSGDRLFTLLQGRRSVSIVTLVLGRSSPSGP